MDINVYHVRDLSEEDLLELIQLEFPQCEAAIEMHMHPISALQLAGLVQLALRHPSVPDEDMRMTAVRFIDGVRAYFKEQDALAIIELIRRGYLTPTTLTCHRCGRCSYNRHDIQHNYCGACHRFADEVES